ncbi:hypothetical protein RHMOL_Rhmol13G0060800 [Rhododendron molle]|uniref:Uncharacterized protein n=1 Tax=Rhododendron molle TaxID=49168 RepID=A0ACC0L3G7_RHOML|nr:hypothetical protein RHMOL_Rhmol13G0060800 [Rhododendron molle]
MASLSTFVDGEYSVPAPIISTPEKSTDAGKEEMPNPDFVLRRRSDLLVCGWVAGSMSEEVLGMVIGLSSSSAEVWVALENFFAQNSQETQQCQMPKRQDYLSKFKSLCCDDLCAVGCPANDRTKSFWLLQGLGPPQYESFTTTMLKPPMPSFNVFIPLLRSYETRMGLYDSDIQVGAQQNIAFSGQKNNAKNRTKFFQGQDFFSSEGKGFAKSRQNGRNANGDSQHRQGGRGDNCSYKNDSDSCGKQSVICQICSTTGHSAFKCDNRFNFSNQPEDIPQVLVSSTADVPIVEWLIDTGASDHNTADSRKLHNLRPYKGNNKGVRVANGDLLPISHIGDATINLGHRTILLKNVLVVPEIKQNVFSVSKFTSDYPCNFEFSATSFMIKDRTTKRVIASGRRRGNLFPLKTFKEGYFSNRFCEVAEDIWHARLIIHEVKPKNFLFQLPLTNTAIKLGSLFITPEEVRNHFPVVGIPAETHQMEMLYFTDDRNDQWCMEIEFFQGPFLLRMEAFIDEHNLGVGDMIKFYKADQPLHPRHFLIGFVKGRGDPTESGTTAVNGCMDRGGDSEGDGGGGAIIGNNGQGDDGGGSRSEGRKWWKFSFGGCCVGMKRLKAIKNLNGEPSVCCRIQHGEEDDDLFKCQKQKQTTKKKWKTKIDEFQEKKIEKKNLHGD